MVLSAHEGWGAVWSFCDAITCKVLVVSIVLSILMHRGAAWWRFLSYAGWVCAHLSVVFTLFLVAVSFKYAINAFSNAFFWFENLISLYSFYYLPVYIEGY